MNFRNKGLIIFAVLASVILLYSGLTQSPGKSVIEPESKFYFAQLTDTHLGDADNLERTLKVIDSINALSMPIACVVHTGDITMNKLANEEVLSDTTLAFTTSNAPVHYVPGNHDILAKDAENTAEIYRKNFSKLFSAAEYGGVVFIFIYTEPLARGTAIKDYEPLKILHNALDQIGGKPVLIFHHTPSVEDFYGNKMHDGWKREIRKRWEDLINSYNVKAVFAGHFHRDEHHWIGDVPLYVCPPVAGYHGRQTTYRIYEYDNGRISYRTQYVK